MRKRHQIRALEVAVRRLDAENEYLNNENTSLCVSLLNVSPKLTRVREFLNGAGEDHVWVQVGQVRAAMEPGEDTP